MSATTALNKFAQELDGRLLSLGFVLRNRVFIVRRNENVGLIHIQKSIKSTASMATFTINLGVWCKRLAALIPRSTTRDIPDIDDCHWRERVGFVRSERSDVWWTVESAQDARRLAIEVAPLIGAAAMEVLRLLDDGALRDELLQGRAPGLTEMQRLMYVTALLAELGPIEQFERSVEELKREVEGKPSEAMILRFIERLGEPSDAG